MGQETAPGTRHSESHKQSNKGGGVTAAVVAGPTKAGQRHLSRKHNRFDTVSAIATGNNKAQPASGQGPHALPGSANICARHSLVSQRSCVLFWPFNDTTTRCRPTTDAGTLQRTVFWFTRFTSVHTAAPMNTTGSGLCSEFRNPKSCPRTWVTPVATRHRGCKVSQRDTDAPTVCTHKRRTNNDVARTRA